MFPGEWGRGFQRFVTWTGLLLKENPSQRDFLRVGVILPFMLAVEDLPEPFAHMPGPFGIRV